MKRKLFLAALIVATGCKVQIDQPPPANPTASTTPSASAPLPTTSGSTATSTGAAANSTSGSSPTASTTPKGSTAAGTSSSTSTPSSSSTSTVPTTASQSHEAGYNPDRVYQLSALQTTDLTINGQKLTVWVADADGKRSEGLMSVKDDDIKADQGMIFAFPQAKEQGCWMKHTYIPLDIAYIAPDKTVVSTATMKPFDETNTPSKGSSQYVLEMKEGTLQRLGIQKGTKIDIPASVKAQDPPPPTPGMGGGFGG